MSSGAYHPRTYGKRFTTKRKPTPESLGDDEPPEIMPKKRRKITVGRVIRSPSPTKTGEDVQTDEDELPNPIPTLRITHEPPSKRDILNTVSSIPVPSTPPAAKPKKLVRDLSKIFEAIAPSPSPSSSPTKLAKRMLARSKTDSSIESHSTSAQSNSCDRTPSLPNLPPSSHLRSLDANSPKDTLPVLPSLVASPKPNATRTYAGQFRSFLVAVPNSSLPEDSNSQRQEGEDDEFGNRESYTSLRTRWGVDNSEDDPYPYVPPSPTKSHSATPDRSPSRNGKGKTKAVLLHSRTLPAGMMNPLKSISELRNKGETRRFLDEIGYLFEGMDKSGTTGLKHASALEITTKFYDTDFFRKAKAADCFVKTWDAFLDAGAGTGEDKILDILLVFFVFLVSRDSACLADLSERSSSESSSCSEAQHGSSLSNTLFTLFPLYGDRERDPLLSSNKDGQRKSGISKKEWSTLLMIHKTIASQSHIFSEKASISTSLLISSALHSIPHSHLSRTHFPTLLASLRTSLATDDSLSSNLEKHWRNAANNVPFEAIYYQLRLLEVYLLDQWQGTSVEGPAQAQSQGEAVGQDRKVVNEQALETARDEWLVDELSSLALCTELKAVDCAHDAAAVQRCVETTLRILVSLTHADELWGQKVLQSGYAMGFLLRTIHKAGVVMQRSRVNVLRKVKPKVEDGAEEESADSEEENDDRAELQALDTLCLALGLLTNLVQQVEDVKQVVRDIRLNPSCLLKKRTCARKCTCSSPSSGIDILVNLYAQQQIKIELAPSNLAEPTPEAHAEADASFLRGHLAILFGLLMMGSPENQSVILAALPSLSPNKAKPSNRVKLSGLVEHARDFVAFYDLVSRKLTGGENESELAREVVRFLERERDAAV